MSPDSDPTPQFIEADIEFQNLFRRIQAIHPGPKQCQEFKDTQLVMVHEFSDDSGILKVVPEKYAAVLLTVVEFKNNIRICQGFGNSTQVFAQTASPERKSH